MAPKTVKTSSRGEAAISTPSAPTVPAEAPSPRGPEKADLRSYWSLVATMFQGAFSDNVLKFIVTMLALDIAIGLHGPGEKANAAGAFYQMMINLSFAIPWILAVGFAGWLSDRFSKARVTQGTKMLEIAIMGLATMALGIGSIWFCIGVVFLMMLQSALFGPAKYGILPEILPERRIAWGNGVLQGFTFLSILVGTLVGPYMYGNWKGMLWLTGLLLVLYASVGMVASLFMRPIPPANPTEQLRLNPFSMLRIYGGEIARHTGLRWSIAGVVVFWGVAVMLQSAAVQILKNVLQIEDTSVGVAMLPIVLGNGIGCFLVSILSRDRIELGLVPLGALGIFLTCLLTWWLVPVGLEGEVPAAWLKTWLPIAMGLVGACCGPFIVPLQSYIVNTSDPRLRGGIWATQNLLVAFSWVVIGAVMYMLIMMYRGNPGDAMLVSGIIMLLVCAVMCWRFPRIPLHFIIMMAMRPFYRFRSRGTGNIPASGGAMLAPNHMSYLDAVFLAAVIDRPIRFVMSQGMYNKWYIYPFARVTDSIPVESSQSARDLIASLRAARDEVARGGLVCLFPEGQIARVGMMMPFRRGIERIMKDLAEPIIPVGIDGAYDTGWAKPTGRLTLLRRHPFRRFNISIVIGEPVASSTSPAELRRHVVRAHAEAFSMRKADAEPLHRMALRTLRRNPRQRMYADHASDGFLPNYKSLAGIVLLGKRLRSHWDAESHVGFLLPTAIGTALLNVAALAAGKVPVNLNYTVSPGILTTICDKAGIRVVITSREFLAKANLAVPGNLTVVYTEDLRKDISATERVIAMLQGLYMPLGHLERMLGRSSDAGMDDLATLVFSSGSTGVPKGVMLTHWNIWSNARGALQYVHFENHHRLVGALPFFHSFGYLAALWLPLMRGVPIVFYPNPLDGKAIGAIIERYHVTHLFGTPTFLATYIRRVEPPQLGTLEFVLTGAEKLREQMARAFEQRFGIRPIEGFGTTECSPVVALSTSGWRGKGIFQAGSRPGSVGQPIPGVLVRIVDLDTGAELPPNTEGMLLVKGPNVMQGYYKMEDKTQEVLRDGWYQTGDLAKVDEDGFLTITDRLSRFSKIGGEMVPHLKVEEVLQQAAGLEEPSFAVAGVPDEKKGERLVVLYTLPEAEARKTLERIADPDFHLPALWIPRWQDFKRIDAIPILGSGKLDLKLVKELALDAESTQKSEDS